MNDIDGSYVFGTTLDGTVDEVVERTTRALAAEGFGILTRIDVHDVFERKLGVKQEPYVILGACNPELAHRAIGGEPEIGALLPCNVVVRRAAPDRVEVLVADPQAMFRMVRNPSVQPVADEAEHRLRRAVEALGGATLDLQQRSES